MKSGPAFPGKVLKEHYEGKDYYNYPSGMSKRFYAAAGVLQGLVARGARVRDETVETAYKYADELLRQEKGGK